MLASFLIAFREGLEAFLLVGIMLSYLERVNASAYKRYLYLGVAGGLLASLGVAFVFQVVISQFESEYYRSVLMIGILLFASGVLSYMAIWMQRQARARTSAVQKQLDAHIGARNLLGMVSLSFAAVLREGIETVLFFSALAYAPGGLDARGALSGALLGLGASVGLIYAMLQGSRRVPLAAFFKYTGLLILVIAAGLFASSINLMQSIGWLPPSAELFDISFILGDEAGLGLFLRALFGYNAAPTPLQFAAWVGYLAVFVTLWRRAYVGARAERFLVLGAGPAGLMAGYELARAGRSVAILERAPAVGGLSGSRSFQAASGSYRFDFGGHRFITANAELLALVEELLGGELLVAERSSVIRLGGRTYAYPLALGNLLCNAPPSLLVAALHDLARVSLRRRPRDDCFASWIESRFGSTLYRAFFEGYTRKLWGIDPRHLSADWADQRISLVDLRDVARRLLPGGAGTPRTYARRYRYPKTGFGLLFERLAERFAAAGGELRLGTGVVGLRRSGERIDAVRVEQGGVEQELAADHVISTLPMPELVAMTGGESKLRFRGLRFLNLVMDVPDVSPYTWQYLSDPDVLATRLQEPRRRSPFMAPPGMSSLMLEIPCDPGDSVWSLSDAELFARGCADLDRLGVDSRRATGEYFSTRTRCAYPFMDLDYASERRRAIEWLSRIGNLSLCGRQGTFRYIFSDTAMEMGMQLARTLIERPGVRPDVLELRNGRTVIETESIA